MIDEPLLATKLAPPPLRATLVGRRRLHERLGAALDHTLTLIVAPAGSGKTTLLVSWLQGVRAALPVAWLSLDEQDDDPARFWRYLLAAVERVAPGVAAAASAMLAAAPEAAPEPALTALLNALAAHSDDLLLALDDYHLIGDPAIQRGMTFLVSHAPPGLRLLIAGRSQPPLPVERLRVRGRLLEFGPPDLRFTRPEAAALLADSLGLDLGPDAVTTLVERTEGWGAGLVLAALAARGRDDPAAFAHSFGGASPLVLDYVAAEVLRGQPADVSAFLLQTAPLDRLCAEVCDAVRGRDDSQALLQQVERSGLFLIPLDDEGRWFRYHHLFAEVLRARLARTDPAALRDSRRRAAGWLAAQGLAAEAIGYALGAAAWDEAAALIATAGQGALMRGETATVRAWLAALPPHIARASAGVALLSGWLHVLAGDLAAAATQIAVVEAAAVAGEQADELRALRAIVALTGGHLAGGLDLAALPAERLPRGAFVGAVQAIARGLHAELEGEVVTAAAAYAEAARLSEAGGSPLLSCIALCQLGEVQLLQGRLRDAEGSYRRADELRQSDPTTAAAVGKASQIGLGAVAFERGDYARAEALIVDALDGSMVLRDLAAIEAHTYLAQIAAARGAFEAAARHLDIAAALARALGSAPLLPMVEAAQAQLDVRRGELGRAAAWLDAIEGPGLSGLPGGVRELVNLGRARVLAAIGRHDEALALLDDVAAAATAAGRGRVVIESLLTRSTALAGRGRAAAARASLDAAAALAGPAGFVALLQGEGYEPDEATARPLPALPQGPLLGGHDVTERELEVLRLIAEGLGNEAIARQLVVAPGTVKKHINRIFAKLEAQSRTQAIVRARALGLLD